MVRISIKPNKPGFYLIFDVTKVYQPDRLLGRKTESQVAIFHDNELVAVHFPIFAGKRRTNKDHYPPDTGKYMEWDTEYCIREAGKVGVNTTRIVHSLLNEEVIRNLRSAQNIIRLQNKYGEERLEAACTRAVYFGNYDYHSIKTILEKELDKHNDIFSPPERQLSDTYARSIDELINGEVLHGNTCSN